MELETRDTLTGSHHHQPKALLPYSLCYSIRGSTKGPLIAPRAAVEPHGLRDGVVEGRHWSSSEMHSRVTMEKKELAIMVGGGRVVGDRTALLYWSVPAAKQNIA